MRIIVDECLPNKLTKALSVAGHSAVLVQKAGYSGLEDGALLREIQDEFDVFVTIDGNLLYQQNLAANRVGIVVLKASTNAFEDLEPLIPDVLAILETIQPGEVTHVPSA